LQMSRIGLFRVALVASFVLNWLWYFSPWMDFGHVEQVRELLAYDGFYGVPLALNPDVIFAWHVIRSLALVLLFFVRPTGFFLFCIVLVADFFIMTFGGVFVIAPFERPLYSILYLIDGVILMQAARLFLQR